MATANLESEIKAHLTRIEKEAGERVDRLRTRVDDLEACLRAPDPPGWREKHLGGLNGYTTPGNRFIEAKNLRELFNTTRRVRFQVGQFHPVFEEKTLVDSTALGFTTPGVLGSQNISPSIVEQPRRRLTVRDILRSKPIDQPSMHFIFEDNFTNAASPQVEGSAKGESAVTFDVTAERVRTLAHWLPVTRQCWDDLPELRRFIDNVLLYGLKLKEEAELLSGDNTGEHLNGLITQAGTYSGTYNVSGDTKLDKLRHSLLEMEDLDEMGTGFILHPKDVHDIDLIKTEEGGANKGMYVVGDPLGGTLNVRTYWGRPVVASRSMTQGRFLVGDFSKAMIGDRMDATIDVSEEHSTFFTENKLAIRCEERIALAVMRPSAFLYGQF